MLNQNLHFIKIPGDSLVPQSLSNSDPGPGETRINATHQLEICFRGTKHTQDTCYCSKPSQPLPSGAFPWGLSSFPGQRYILSYICLINMREFMRILLALESTYLRMHICSWSFFRLIKTLTKVLMRRKKDLLWEQGFHAHPVVLQSL